MNIGRKNALKLKTITQMTTTASENLHQLKPIKIALIGAGSRSFGPATVRDVLLSEPLNQRGVELVLMDSVQQHLPEVEAHARDVARRLERRAPIAATTDLAQALDGADFVITAIEVNRYLYWAQDFHIPRQYGFKQPYGENGGPGGLFHALRNMGPTIQIARAMERLCPGALLINYTNPEHRLCEAIARLTKVRAVGLCHGVFMGRRQIAAMLQIDEDHLDTAACGINHFTWFQSVRDRRTGQDLYPQLRQIEQRGDWLADWHEIALGRVLLRRFGLWPSPAANHYGEYIRWADEFVASEMQYFYDPADGHPWNTGQVPEFVYSMDHVAGRRPWIGQSAEPKPLAEADLKVSGELAAPIMEALSCAGAKRELPAINVPNRGAIPGLPDDLVVEVPATADARGIHPCAMQPLPEAIAAMIRLQGSIHKLIVEAFAEQSKAKLLQALLLDPFVDSYRRAASMLDHMLELQREILPEFR